MASSVFYKFSSRKDESRVTFDGTGISVFDLKRDIILANNMGKANDFDLVVLDGTSKQEYADDSQIIPRSSSVIVKRLPALRPGKGKASIYTAGAAGVLPTSEPVRNFGGTWHKGAMSKRFDGKEEKPLAPATSTPATAAAGSSDEAAAMAAMFEAQTANWEETQEKMSQAQRISSSNYRGTGFQRGGKPYTPHMAPQQPDRPLPASYVCYRCGQKGHWIKDCPTNNDRDFDHRPRIKRTTGIPRSMLKVVENPTSEQLGQGVMVTPEGGYVVAQPDSASWQKQVSRPKGLTAAEIRERPSTDPSLVCPIDNKLFRDAVKTPCCGTVYCEECIQTHLLERDFICPNCAKKVPSLDKLVMDKPMRIKVADYIEKAVEESKKEEQSAADSAAIAGSEGATNEASGSTGQEVNLEQEIYSEQQPGSDMDLQAMLVASIPQMQAQIHQINVMLQNPSLPNQLRQSTEIQQHQLKMQLQQAQTMSAAFAAAASFQQQQVNPYNNMQGWNGTGFVNQQPAGQDSAYQRLPVNNRRRFLKRDRPSDFLEMGEESKVARYTNWDY
ncbi:DWNN domain-containing protein [Mycena floridula]|nr:DWNN domain-containing protein [Mycena floridula]